MLPVELIIEIYKKCDYQTRIKFNKAYKWNFKVINPLFDYKHPTSPTRSPPTPSYIVYNWHRIASGMGGLAYSR
jgi:hypothetical protein